MPNIQGWLLLHTPTRMRGRVVGLFVLMLYLGQFLSPFITYPLKTPFGLTGIFLIGSYTLFVLLVIPITLLIIDFVKKNKSYETKS